MPFNQPLTLSSGAAAYRRAGERWLTTRSVEALSVAAATLFRDRELAGFGVLVEPSGRKTYVMELGGAGGARSVVLGRHGAISADRARGRAAALLAGDAPGAATVAAVANRYMREYVAVRCKPATQAQYRLAIDRHIVPALGGMPIAAVGRAQVAALQHSLADRPATANQAVATLARLIEQAADWGLAPARGNPCRSVAKYRVRRHERFLTESEFRRLGAALDALEAGGGISVHAAAAIRLLALTGCRRNEILTLRWEDVRLDAGELRLRDTKTGPRIVPISPAAAKILGELPRIPGNPWVVPGRKPGAPLSGIFLQWRRARGLAGLDEVRLHDLRHSFASRALALGESLPTIARLLGHARVQTTSRYAHLARDTVKEAAARVAADIGGDILPGLPGAASPPGGAVAPPVALPPALPGWPGPAAPPPPGLVRASAERIAACIGADILPRYDAGLARDAVGITTGPGSGPKQTLRLPLRAIR